MNIYHLVALGPSFPSSLHSINYIGSSLLPVIDDVECSNSGVIKTAVLTEFIRLVSPIGVRE